MKKEYIIIYSIGDDKQLEYFELMMGVGFEWIRKRHYNTVKYFKIISPDDAGEMERKMRLIADAFIWGKDDGLEMLNLNVAPREKGMPFTDEERIIIRGDGKLEEEIIPWMELMFLLKQVVDRY